MASTAPTTATVSATNTNVSGKSGSEFMAFPPYPPYEQKPPPPSIADTIYAGREVRMLHKSVRKKAAAHKPPGAAKPRGPKATDIKMTPAQMRAHARCLKRHGAGLTDRLERMAKPSGRHVLSMWRQHAHALPAETIQRLRNMLAADEPFKPDQAYAYFENLNRGKKKGKDKTRNKKTKKDLLTLCGGRRFLWARNATVAFARGIQQRLSRPGRYELADGMLRLSDIILNEICGYMRTRPPSRYAVRPKARFMVEMSDKIAIWIDEILSESDDRMLMMDFDEDDEVAIADETLFYDPGFTDDFLDMMGDKGTRIAPPKPAYTKLKGDALKAFRLLTDAMDKKGAKNLINRGQFKQSYKEGADSLRQALDFTATDYDEGTADDVNKKLTELMKPITRPELEEQMKSIIETSSKYLVQNAEYNKDKGPAFRELVRKMKAQPTEILCTKDKVRKTMGAAAKDLEDAKGLDTDHENPILAQTIYNNLSKLVEDTPVDKKMEMENVLDKSSKYLSQLVTDESERGPAFERMVQELENNGSNPFTPQYKDLATDRQGARALRMAPGLKSTTADKATAPTFAQALHREVDAGIPQAMKYEVNSEVIPKSADYLSGHIRDRGKVKDILVKTLKSNAGKIAAKRKDHEMNYDTAAKEVMASPTLTPVLPLKGISDEIAAKFNKDVASSTPQDLKPAMNSLVKDVAGELSQNIALKSGAGGANYPKELLAAVLDSHGDTPLVKIGAYGISHKDAAGKLKNATVLEKDKANAELSSKFNQAITKSVKERVTPDTAHAMAPIIQKAADHLAKEAAEEAAALDHLLLLMYERGDENLSTIQGKPTTYAEAADRVRDAPSLRNDRVDKAVHETVKTKLKRLVKDNPPEKNQEKVLDVVDDVSKFLAVPFPDDPIERQKILAQLMANKGKEVVDQGDIYKMTYHEGAGELEKAPMKVPVKDQIGQDRIDQTKQKVNEAVEDRLLQEALKDETAVASKKIAETVTGRDDAMKAIIKKMDDTNKPLASHGRASMSHKEGAKELKQAQNFLPVQPVPSYLSAEIKDKIKDLDVKPTTAYGKEQLQETEQIAAKYLAGNLAQKAGLVPGSKEDEAARARYEEAQRQKEAALREQTQREQVEREQRLRGGPGAGGGPGGYGAGGSGTGPDGYGPGGLGTGPGGPGTGPGGYGPGGPGTGPGGVGTGAGGYGPGGPGTEPGGVGTGAGGYGPGGPGTGPGGAGTGPGGYGPGGPGTGPGGYGPGGHGTGPGGIGTGPGGAGTGPGGYGPGGLGTGPGGAGGAGTGPGGYGPGGPGTGPGSPGGYGPGGPGTGPGGYGPGGPGTGPGGVGTGPGGAGTGPGGYGPGGPGTGPGGVGTGPGGVGTGPGGIGGAGGVGTGAGGYGPGTGPGGVGTRPGGDGTGPGGYGTRGPGTGPGGYGPGGAGTGPGGPETGPGGAGTGPGSYGPGGPGTGPGGTGGPGGYGPGGTGGPGGYGPGGTSGPGGYGPGGPGTGLSGTGGPGGYGPGGPGTGPGGAGTGPGGYGPGGPGTGPGGAGTGPGGYGPGGVGTGGYGAGGPGTGPGGIGTGPGGAGTGPGGYGPGGPGTGPGGAGTGPGGAGTGPGGAGTGPGGAGTGPGGTGTGLGGAGTGPGGVGTGIPGAGGPGTAGPGGAGTGPGGYGPGGPGTGPGGAGTGTGGPGTEPGGYGPGGPGTGPGGYGPGGPGTGPDGYGPGGPGTGPGGYGPGGPGSYGPGGPGTGPDGYGPSGAQPETRKGMRRGADGEWIVDPEHAKAEKLLIQKLKSKGDEEFYELPQAKLTHGEAADVLSSKKPIQDRSVKDATDTDRLAKKFERKLDNLVANQVPKEIQDAMSDVIVESSRELSEYFVSKNYGNLVKEALIAEMQKRGNEILIDNNGASESFIYAAQRLKDADVGAHDPSNRTAYQLSKKLEEGIRCRAISRKLVGPMKDHVKHVSEFLSDKVTKPDPKIDAYVVLLQEMEARGRAKLVEGNIPKSYEDAAAYLKQLTSNKDRIGRSNSSIQSKISSNLKDMMKDVQPQGYTKNDMNSVIDQQSKLLTSYLVLQAEKTEALKELVGLMEKEGDTMILRHGSVRKTFKDAVELLRGKNTDELNVRNTEPVVTRKLQLKILQLMREKGDDSKYKNLRGAVLLDATDYLAVHLLEPQIIHVCKCMKSVFVQCELWCEEILRRAARPSCCTCSRHVSTQALADIIPSQSSYHPGMEIKVTRCPTATNTTAICPGTKSSSAGPGPCATLRKADAYCMYTSTTGFKPASPVDHSSLLQQPCCTALEAVPSATSPGHTPTMHTSWQKLETLMPEIFQSPPFNFSDTESLNPENSELQLESPTLETHVCRDSETDRVSKSKSFMSDSFQRGSLSNDKHESTGYPEESEYTTASQSTAHSAFAHAERSHAAIHAAFSRPAHSAGKQRTGHFAGRQRAVHSTTTSSMMPHSSAGQSTHTTFSHSVFGRPRAGLSPSPTRPMTVRSMATGHMPVLDPPNTSADSGYRTTVGSPVKILSRPHSSKFRETSHESTATVKTASINTVLPIKVSCSESKEFSDDYASLSQVVKTTQMSDMHAMIVSLMWNVQAWRDWLREHIDTILAPHTSIDEPEEADTKWFDFKKRVMTEAMQWRYYSSFSRQLTLRLAIRYKDKQIVSPNRGTVKTHIYTQYQEEMLEIIEMLNKWTQWLVVILKQTDTLKPDPGLKTATHELCWDHVRKKVEARLADWVRYNMHLKVHWDQRHEELNAGWAPTWKDKPVWVVSACGAVPSGAVAAGLFNDEVTWVARTTHRCKVLPAALVPSKHSCMVYSGEKVHFYTKYQVMCNAEVQWRAWRASPAPCAEGRGVAARAVRAAPGVFVGRVLYHGSHLLGAVLPPHYRCHVAIYDRPFAFNCYELLVLAD